MWHWHNCGSNCQIIGTWIPAQLLTRLLHHEDVELLQHWLVGALHGTLRGFAALHDHWILLELRVQGNALYVHMWDGLDHQGHQEVRRFVDFVASVLVIRTIIIEFGALISQTYPHTCGAVAIMHLGLRLELLHRDSLPEELEVYDILNKMNLNSCLFGKGWDEIEDDHLLPRLQEILHHHGVPENRSEERVLMAFKRIGKAKLLTAMNSKNQWAALKALGSLPKNNFLWVKPDELEKQIKFRANSKFKIATSEKKRSSATASTTRAQIDPKLLKLIPNTFITDDEREVKQILMEEVAADKAGLAFGTLGDVLPFLKEDKSITMDALAVLTTSPVPPDSQGLIPVSNLRFPAVYEPTMETILVDGSLVQLGDSSILRKQAEALAEAKTVATKTLKVTVWREEWPGKWQDFTAAPVKKMIERTPRLLLCKGDRCGSDCNKFHAPVDCDLDQVIVDLWSRGWHSGKGKRSPPEDADQFSVLLRIPSICADGLQQRSGQDGIYFEPRQADGRGPAEEFTVVWINTTDKGEAIHKLKVTDRAIALVRFGNRYGLRTLLRDAEAVHKDVHPDQPFENVNIQSVYEVRPLPHGMQTAGVRDLLQQWNWKAKALQPYRADQHGQGWLIGSEAPPPSTVFQTSFGDVLVTQHKKPDHIRQGQVVLSSQKTMSHMKQDKVKKGKNSTPDKENVMPWTGKDPWGGFNNFKEADSSDQRMTPVSKWDRLQDHVQGAVADSLRDATEQRFQKLETGMSELKVQNQKFESWFQEAGHSNAALRKDVNALASQVKDNQQNIQSMNAEIRTGFSNIEALLSKKHRQE
eukprot:s1865_g8.t1